MTAIILEMGVTVAVALVNFEQRVPDICSPPKETDFCTHSAKVINKTSNIKVRIHEFPEDDLGFHMAPHGFGLGLARPSGGQKLI